MYDWRKDCRIIRSEKNWVWLSYFKIGITQVGVVWPNAIHQMLQLKHCLKLTPKNVTTNFLSNDSYQNVWMYLWSIWNSGIKRGRRYLSCGWVYIQLRRKTIDRPTRETHSKKGLERARIEVQKGRTRRSLDDKENYGGRKLKGGSKECNKKFLNILIMMRKMNSSSGDWNRRYYHS